VNRIEEKDVAIAAQAAVSVEQICLRRGEQRFAGGDRRDLDAEPHLFVHGSVVIFLANGLLDRNGALHGIDRAGEVCDDAVAGGVEDPAPVRRDQSVDDGAACLQPGERADLVARHQPAVAGNVGGEYRCELSFDALTGHACSSPSQYSDERDLSGASLIVAARSHGTQIVRFPAQRFARQHSQERQLRVGLSRWLGVEGG